MKNRIIYVLIGPPAIGKSTWIKNMTDPANTFVVNRDEIVEQVADSIGFTYDDLYVYPPNDAEIGNIDEKYGKVIASPEYIFWSPTVFDKVLQANKSIKNTFYQKLEDAKNTNKNVVIDLTNLKTNERLDCLDRVGQPGDVRIAVVFKFINKEKVIKAVAKKRAEATKRMGKSKTIPDSAFDRMISGYQPPTPEERYDKIIYSDTIPQLKKLTGLKEAKKIIRQIINEKFSELS